MAMEKTSTRVAMGLMCALAICCAVMYITADGAETVLATEDREPAKSVFGIGGPTSVDSEDVQKAGTVVTNTPDGRMRLTDYLTNVEKEIAAEEAARKRDVDAVREEMARNFAFNQAARKKLKSQMLHKMAKNAKKAKRELDKSMRFVQRKFAAAAKLQNERNNANIARSKSLRDTITANKKEGQDNLKAAVLTQQRAMAALASATNARIDQTNKHVAINAAQIKENAKKAREELAAAVDVFDTKVANAREEAAQGRSKLAEQLQSQDKSLRQWANNKLKRVMAKTAAQFARVRAKMAEDRHNADMALKSASSTMTASLNANAALNDKRFASTVADIAAAKKEAEERVQAAETSFKTSLFALTTTVNHQVKKTNERINQLSDTVEKHKVEQAKVNANVDAEAKRMIDLGNARYAEHLNKDAELKSLVDANKAATNKRLEAMGAHYKAELGAVKATMKKNRAHASHQLAKKSAELYAEIAKNEQQQANTNADLAAQTARAQLDIQDSLREAKADFASRLGALTDTVADNDKKFEDKIFKLTGIVVENAEKSRQGRQELKTIMDANKVEMHTAVRDAIAQGEKRMQAAQDHLTDMNAKTKAALNMKITTEISGLAKRANSQIETLRLNSAEARAAMKKELLFAVRAMADTAKTNLDAAVDSATAAFARVNGELQDASDKAAEERAQISADAADNKEYAKQQLTNAVKTMQVSLQALKHETEEKIKKTNNNVDAYAQALAKEAKDVSAIMTGQMTTLTGKIEAQKAEAKANIAAADAKSAAGFESAMNEVEEAMAAAQKVSDDKFNTLTTDMANQRADLDKELAGAVTKINDSIAKQAALADSRFSKTVKDIHAARKEAADEVQAARKEFATDLLAVTESIKEMDSKMLMDVQKISGEVIEHSAMMTRVNSHVKGEIARVEKLMNDRQSKSKQARGKLRAILDENKRAAADEVAALDTLFKGKIESIEATAESDAESARNDLIEKSTEMAEALESAQREALYAQETSKNNIITYSVEATAAIKASEADFENRLTELADVIAAHHDKNEASFEVLTGVVRDFKEEGEADRALIRKQNDALNAQMSAAIETAIQKGEAEMKAVADRARENLAAEKQAMLIEITETVEDMADKAFKVIQGKHQKIADNYLSLKAYAVTAASQLAEYVKAGKGKNLSSLGDLLVNIAALSDVVVTKEEGFSPSSEIRNIFSSEKIPVDNSVSKIHGLVNEYVKTESACRERWSMGLGKYLLQKLQGSMSEKGVLQVDKVDGKSGNWVFVNGHAVGLSNKLNDFEGLAVRMSHYESTLAKLTASLSGKALPAAGVQKTVYVPAPEWKGD